MFCFLLKKFKNNLWPSLFHITKPVIKQGRVYTRHTELIIWLQYINKINAHVRLSVTTFSHLHVGGRPKTHIWPQTGNTWVEKRMDVALHLNLKLFSVSFSEVFCFFFGCSVNGKCPPPSGLKYVNTVRKWTGLLHKFISES